MYVRLWLLALLICLARVLEGQTRPGYPPSTPFLRIETGMHMTEISRIDVDAAERILVSASEDKTARVWDLRDGKLLQILRPPQGAGPEGMLYAVAISPDGSTIAVGGYTGPTGGPFSVYLYGRVSGALIRTIGEFPQVVEHLSYSGDGRYLAVALGANGIGMYRTSDYTKVARDMGYQGDCYWVEFDGADRLVTASFDGFVRLYNSDFHLIAKVQPPGGKQPYSARFSPDGSKVAVGFRDTAAVNVLSGQDLSFSYAPETPSSDDGNLSKVAWSRDGQVLYAAGGYQEWYSIYGLVISLFKIVSWPGRGTEPVYWITSGNTVMDILALLDGRVVFGTRDPRVGVLDRAGHVLWQHYPEILYYKPPRGEVRLSGDGSTVAFGYTTPAREGWDKHFGRFELARKQLSLGKNLDTSLAAPRVRMDGLEIAGSENSEHPTLNGQALALDRYETSRSLAVSATTMSFLLGTEWSIRLFDHVGKQKWQTPVPGVAWAVNLTDDGRFAVAALGDGTIRWYRTDNGREVMVLFVHPDGNRWVLWTPEGFYDASPGADTLIGYHLNRGPDHDGEFVGVEQLAKLFYRPDLLSGALKPDSEKRMQAELARIGDVSKILHSGSAPEMASLSPSETDSDGSFRLQFRVANRGGGIGRIVYRIDGAEITGRPVGPPAGSQDTVARQFDLPPGRHTVSATVYNGSNQVESRSISTVVNVRQAQERPALYVAAVGISKYRDHSLDGGVQFAASDAKSIAARLKQDGAGLFREVFSYVLQDESANRDNIEKTVTEIAGRIQPNDEFILYLAGHGTAINGEYTFVPWNAIYTSSDALQEQSLTEERLQALLKNIPANKTLVLLDTCSAGAAISGRAPDAEKGSIERLSKLTGRATIAASSTDQMALEGYQGHGVFTYAVLEALSTAVDKNGLVQVSTLADRVEELVPQITRERWNYEQFPMRSIQGQTFPVARKQ